MNTLDVYKSVHMAILCTLSCNYTTTLTLTTLATLTPRPHQESSRRPPRPLRQDTRLSAREVVVPAKERISIK